MKYRSSYRLCDKPGPSMPDVPAVNWAQYVEAKSVQYVKKGQALRVAAQKENDWDKERAVRETDKKTFQQTCSS